MIKYNNIKVDGKKISPSSLNTFRRNKKEWLKSFRGEASFVGNYSSILGTVIHYVFESEFDKRTGACYYQDTREYVDSEAERNTISQQEADEIYQLMVSGYYARCVSWLMNEDTMKVVDSEPEVVHKLGKAGNETYYIAGSIDALIIDDSDVLEDSDLSVNKTNKLPKGKLGIRDYKSSKRKALSMSGYLSQLLTYVVAYNATHERKVEFIEVINIVTTKTKGLQFYTMRYNFTEDDLKKVKALLKEIINSLKLIETNPVLEPYIFSAGVSFMGTFDLLKED